jgi:hypothetical protein
MLDIDLKTISRSKQRYPTVGDYFTKPNGREHTSVRVSEMGNWRYEFLVGVHELVEWALIRYHGVSEQEVDAWDLKYEAERKAGDLSESGDAVGCPYAREHTFATCVERLVAIALDVNWKEYNKFIEEL